MGSVNGGMRVVGWFNTLLLVGFLVFYSLEMFDVKWRNENISTCVGFLGRGLGNQNLFLLQLSWELNENGSTVVGKVRGVTVRKQSQLVQTAYSDVFFDRDMIEKNAMHCRLFCFLLFF